MRVAKIVGAVAALLIAGLGGFAGHTALHAPVTPVVAPSPVTVTETPGPEPTTPPEPVAPGLKRVAIPTPPVVTGLPYSKSCHSVNKLPDPTCTPGSINPAVTQDNIASTICTVGWTATVRPPLANTTPVKTAAMKAYGVPATKRGIVELDHLVPLELSGSDDVSNLWPEVSDIPNDGFNNQKDLVEDKLRSAVCSGKVTLTAAQNAIATNWTTAEQTLGLK